MKSQSYENSVYPKNKNPLEIFTFLRDLLVTIPDEEYSLNFVLTHRKVLQAS